MAGMPHFAIIPPIKRAIAVGYLLIVMPDYVASYVKLSGKRVSLASQFGGIYLLGFIIKFMLFCIAISGQDSTLRANYNIGKKMSKVAPLFNSPVAVIIPL
jgi:hypothetical protein